MTHRAGAARAGFTIVEVLISLVVISLALVGILALLTASTKVAGEVVEDSYAATLARSVYESLREGARKRSFAVQDGSTTVRGFIFVHEGVKNDGFAPADPANCTPPALPTSASDTTALAALRKSDFAIFLPRAQASGTGGATSEPFFVYPRPAADSSGVAAQNQANQDNFFTVPHAGFDAPVTFDVKRVYSLKDRAKTTTKTGTDPGPLEQSDQYGFSVFVRRAKVPPLSSDKIPLQADGMVAVDGYYEVRVNVYRNFDPNERARTHEPLPGGTFVETMAIGF